MTRQKSNASQLKLPKSKLAKKTSIQPLSSKNVRKFVTKSITDIPEQSISTLFFRPVIRYRRNANFSQLTQEFER